MKNKEIEGYLCLGITADCITKVPEKDRGTDCFNCPLREHPAETISDWLWDFHKKKVRLTVEEIEE